jgi:hypothetical protein
MITNEELDEEFRFDVKAYSDGKEEEVKSSLQKPSRQEQREGFVGLLKWAIKVAQENESDRVVASIQQKDDGEKWHRMMKVEVNAGEAWIKVKGGFPRIII